MSTPPAARYDQSKYILRRERTDPGECTLPHASKSPACSGRPSVPDQLAVDHDRGRELASLDEQVAEADDQGGEAVVVLSWGGSETTRNGYDISPEPRY